MNMTPEGEILWCVEIRSVSEEKYQAHSIETLKTEKVIPFPMYMLLRTSKVQITKILSAVHAATLVEAATINLEEKVTFLLCFVLEKQIWQCQIRNMLIQAKSHTLERIAETIKMGEEK